MDTFCVLNSVIKTPCGLRNTRAHHRVHMKWLSWGAWWWS